LVPPKVETPVPPEAAASGLPKVRLPFVSIESAALVEVAKVLGDEVAMYKLLLIERSVHWSEVSEASVSESCGRVELETVNWWTGVVVPKAPTTVVPPFGVMPKVLVVVAHFESPVLAVSVTLPAAYVSPPEYVVVATHVGVPPLMASTCPPVPFDTAETLPEVPRRRPESEESES
jgi:hypothetical protein